MLLRLLPPPAPQEVCRPVGLIMTFKVRRPSLFSKQHYFLWAKAEFLDEFKTTHSAMLMVPFCSSTEKWLVRATSCVLPFSQLQEKREGDMLSSVVVQKPKTKTFVISPWRSFKKYFHLPSYADKPYFPRRHVDTMQQKKCDNGSKPYRLFTIKYLRWFPSMS